MIYERKKVTTVTKYYYAANATRRIRAGKYEFRFEPCDFIAGVWGGIISTDREDEQAALVTLASVGVKEISLEEYEVFGKKKLSPSASKNLVELSQPRNPLRDLATPAVIAKPIVSVPVIPDVKSGKEDTIRVEAVAPMEQPPAPAFKSRSKNKSSETTLL